MTTEEIQALINNLKFTYVSDKEAFDIKDILTDLNNKESGGAVSSVFGRTGAVTAQTNDYSFSQISGTASPTQGGTGLTTYAKGDVLIATGTNTLGVVSASATDGYVFTWDAASGLPMWKVAAGGLPSMTGNSGKFLTTNGTVASWGTVSAVIDTSLDYTWTGKHVFLNSYPTTFGRTFTAIGGVASTTVSAQFKRGISLFDDIYNVMLSNDPNSLLSVNKPSGGYGNILLKLDTGGLLRFPGVINADAGVDSANTITAHNNVVINKITSTGDQGILFWNSGNGNRHAIVHNDANLIIKTCDAGGTPSATSGFSHIVMNGDRFSSTGVTQQTLIRSASNGIGGGINTVSRAAVLDLTNTATLNYFGLKLTSLTTLERDVIFENTIPSGSFYTGSFTNGSPNITTIQSVVIQVGDIISIRVSTVAGTEVARAKIVSIDSVNKTAVMDRNFSGPTGTYYLPYMRTPVVPNGLIIFNSTLDAPQIKVSTGWKTFTLT